MGAVAARARRHPAVSLRVLARLAAVYHTTTSRLVAAILDEDDQTGPNQPAPAPDDPATDRELAAPDCSDRAMTGAAVRVLDSSGDDGLWQLARAMRASNVDATMLDRMEMSVLWAHRIYASLAPVELFPRVQGHLRVVAELLQQPQPIAARRRLCVIAGHLAGLRAWLLFDLGEHQRALGGYDQALEPAAEAGDGALCGWLLGGKSLIPSYAGNPEAALEMVQQAQSYAAGSTNVTCQAWLAALEARAHAGMGSARAYRTAQDQANAAVHQTRLGERRHGMDFDGDQLCLCYYEGTSLAALRQPREAQPVLHQALRVQGASHRTARSIVLLALAGTHVQQKEVDQACRAGEHGASHPARAAHRSHRAAGRRAAGAACVLATDNRVKDLEEQLAELAMVG